MDEKGYSKVSWSFSVFLEQHCLLSVFEASSVLNGKLGLSVFLLPQL